MEKIGFVCKDVSMYPGLGCDILAKHMQDPAGSVWLLEVKNPKVDKTHRALTGSEKELRAQYPERFRVIETLDDAINLLR